MMFLGGTCVSILYVIMFMIDLQELMPVSEV